ncbi:MAG: type II toxin-antitoxin system VapC family toxin [Longimicrobiales bacterium]|nr:type II toxin-antitoxin system VapC family toxin [Longimicrobiales bacterium]
MIFLDSNVPMYLVGADHPNKEAVRRILERLVAGRERLVTDAEVIQEILHRYTAIDRRDAITPCVDALLGLADEVAEITPDDALRARDLVCDPALEGLSARDAIHVAVMERLGLSRLVSFDRGFDRIPGLERIDT